MPQVVSDAIQRQHYAYGGSSGNGGAGSKGITVTLQAGPVGLGPQALLMLLRRSCDITQLMLLVHMLLSVERCCCSRGSSGCCVGATWLRLPPPHKPCLPPPMSLQDGRIFEGRLVSYDTVSDLAVLRVESDSPLPTAKLGALAALQGHGFEGQMQRLSRSGYREGL